MHAIKLHYHFVRHWGREKQDTVGKTFQFNPYALCPSYNSTQLSPLGGGKTSDWVQLTRTPPLWWIAWGSVGATQIHSKGWNVPRMDTLDVFTSVIELVLNTPALVTGIYNYDKKRLRGPAKWADHALAKEVSFHWYSSGKTGITNIVNLSASG